MLYRFGHILRDYFPYIWDFVDKINSFLFTIRYGRKVNRVELELQLFSNQYDVLPISKCKTETLVEFFAHQPKEAFTYFHPHGFDAKSINKLQRNRSFLAYVLIDKQKGKVVGYCFNRSFFHGKGFRGRMVDIDYRGKGLGTMMNKMLNVVGIGIGLQLYESVSRENEASYRSAVSAGKIIVIKELPDNELLLKIEQ